MRSTSFCWFWFWFCSGSVLCSGWLGYLSLVSTEMYSIVPVLRTAPVRIAPANIKLPRRVFNLTSLFGSHLRHIPGKGQGLIRVMDSNCILYACWILYMVYVIVEMCLLCCLGTLHCGEQPTLYPKLPRSTPARIQSNHLIESPGLRFITSVIGSHPKPAHAESLMYLYHVRCLTRCRSCRLV